MKQDTEKNRSSSQSVTLQQHFSYYWKSTTNRNILTCLYTEELVIKTANTSYTNTNAELYKLLCIHTPKGPQILFFGLLRKASFLQPISINKNNPFLKTLLNVSC